MNARWLPVIVGVPAMLLCMVLGMTVGEGHVTVIIGLVGGAIGIAAFVLLAPGAYPEAKIVAVLIFGYVSFQRLFAEINVGRPFFIGELGMAAAFAFLLARIAFRRVNPIPRDVLILPVVLLFAFAAVRVGLLDWKQYRINALKDFATVYYSLFILLGYTIAQHPKSLLLVRRALYFGIIVYVPLIFILKAVSPQRGVTAFVGGILSGRDMAHIVPSAACLLCIIYSQFPKRRPFLIPLALVPLSLVLAGSARSAWVGLVIAAAILMYAEAPSGAQFVAKFLTRAAVVAAMFLVLLSIGSMFDKAAPFTPSVQKLQAIFDFDALASGRTARMGTTDEYATETNRWRTTWWQAVWDETMEKAPLTGLGFGHDLADRFMKEYYGGGISGTRNPHNIWFTLIGRTGLVGASLFSIFVIMLFARVLKVAALVRRRRLPLATLEFWLIDIVILGVAFFSHTLEGPMAAIPFWTFLGIAIAKTQAAMRRNAPPDAPPQVAVPMMQRRRELVPAGAA